MKKIVVIFFIFFTPVFAATGKDFQSFPKADTNKYNSKRLKNIVISEAFIYASSLYLLNNLWYKDYPRSSFHFFNDSKEWLQMDKIGHASTSCFLGTKQYELLKWCGIGNQKAVWYGGGLSSAYLLTIEILDGLSSEWGFSSGDFAANTFGSALFMSQQLVWNEQRIRLKWSYHETEFSNYRPDLLGKDITQTWLKDYNGQTYWLSGNISSFLKKESHFPKWLNIAIGYGAEGMLGGNENAASYNDVVLPYFNRYRQFYFSPDIDFTRIKTNSKFIKAVLYTLNFLKFPAPALEFSKEKKIRIIPLYF